MSIWINNAGRLALIGLLAACQMDLATAPLTGQNRTVSVLGGTMKVAAASGYCVDKGSARSQADGAVVLLGRCSDRSQVPPAVITVTIGAAGSAGAMAGGAQSLTAYFTSPEGRAALSRNGNAESVQILEATMLGDVFLLYVNDAAVGDYWRAVLGLRGRLITLSVQDPDGTLSPVSGRRVLTSTVSAIRSANAPS